MKFVRRWTSIPVPRVYAVILLPPWIFWWRRKWVWVQTVRYPDSAFILWIESTTNLLISIRDFPLMIPCGIVLSPSFMAMSPSLDHSQNCNWFSFGKPVSDDRLAQGWPTDKEVEISGPYADETKMNLALRPVRVPPQLLWSHTHDHTRSYLRTETLVFAT